MSANSYQERQDEEFLALESMFGEDLEDLRENVTWEVSQPLELKLTLKPQQSMGDKGQKYVQLDMVIKCSPSYPDVVPEITLTNSKGLSNQLVAELKAKLEKEANGRVGEVMIWQLASSVQTFLHQNNKPPSPSFYEQMINNKIQQKEMERQKEQQKRQQIEQDLFLQQEALRNEKRRQSVDKKILEFGTPLLQSAIISRMNQLPLTPSPIKSPARHRTARSMSPSATKQPKSKGQRSSSIPMSTEEDDLGAISGKKQAVEATKITFNCNKMERAVHREKHLAKGRDENIDNKEDNEYLTSLVASGQSRLASEFELLEVLGKGGFGDVLKVKNKLDGRFYAIKRIPLNPKSKMLDRKMKREVKLLSRLNHENVVRYYCSWLEISDDPAQSETSASFTSSSEAQGAAAGNKRAPHIVRSIPLTKTPVISAGVKSANLSFDPIGNVEDLVPRVADDTAEWVTSFDKGAENFQDFSSSEGDSSSNEDDSSSSEDDSSSSEDEDDADVFGSSFMPKMDRSDDDSVVFDAAGSCEKITASRASEVAAAVKTNKQSKEAESEPEVCFIKFLYIQMEYCEKSTLRNCIDDGLWRDMDRVWRLFREIVEGLVHIHGQGMIHRDLKPVNIFLDSHDHVKIGDFGLATKDILAKKGATLDVALPPANNSLSPTSSDYSSGNGSLTGKVGTALYVSPEVMQDLGKVHYDQKVDIYSLGIIFFEMCYKSLPTAMERVAILNNLRLPDSILPEDFKKPELHNQVVIISWLLNHDPAQRPTSKDLLSSDLLPPVMEETEFRELLNTTIKDSQSTSYRYMLNAIFNQSFSSIQQLTYDLEMYESQNMNQWKTALVYQHVKTTITKVFTNHGAIHFSLPLFMPKCGIYDNKEQLVKLMDYRGGIVSVPLDLRVPFGRYVGRTCTLNVKRYAIDKVFRDKYYCNIRNNVHPTELTECAFDIITPSSSLIPDAEVLTVVQEIIDKFPIHQARNYYVRINHMSLLKAVLIHCGIPETVHAQTLELLSDSKITKTRNAPWLRKYLNQKKAKRMSSLLVIDGSLSKVTHLLERITKTMGQASSLAKSGLHDIENILSYATCMGFTLQVSVSVGLVYNPSQYSGVVYKVMCDIRKKNKVITEVIAAGGRYDKLIEKFSSPLLKHNVQTLPRGVGISVAFERLANVIAEDEQAQTLSPCDVIVCTLGHQLLVKECLAIAKDLRAAGIRADTWFDKTENFDEFQDSCYSRGISHIVILIDSESSAVKVLSLEKERKIEQSVFIHDLVDYLLRKTSDRVDLIEPVTSSNQRQSNQSHGDCVHTVTTSNIIITSTNAPTHSYNIVFVPQLEKKARRKHEALIAGKTSVQYPWLPEKNLEVLALEMPISSIKTIQVYIEGSQVTQILDWCV